MTKEAPSLWLLEYWFQEDRQEVRAFWLAETAIEYAEKGYGAKMTPHPKLESHTWLSGPHQVVVHRIPLEDV